MRIQILGTGCPKCRELSENAETAAHELGLNYTLEKITELRAIAEFGVMFTPALAVDGKVVSSGEVLSVEAIKPLLR